MADQLPNWFLDYLMDERETMLVRLGRIEDTLIQEGRLSRRTKEPSNAVWKKRQQAWAYKSHDSGD